MSISLDIILSRVIPDKRRSRADPGYIPEPDNLERRSVYLASFRNGSRVDASLRPGRRRGILSMWVYLLASKKHGTLYVGVTSSLSRRIGEHRDGQGSEFASRYGALRLVYAEHFDNAHEAIAHEKRIKHWRRNWKLALIERANPDWNDLYPTAHLD